MSRPYKTIMTLLFCLLIPAVGSAQTRVDCPDRSDCNQESTNLNVREPDISPLAPNRTLMHDRWYMRVNNRTEVFDMPNGNVTRVIEEGFNFVTALSQENGWTQINPGEWVKDEAVTDSNWVVSQFTGVLLPEEGLQNTLVWALVNMYPSPEPGANPSERFNMIYRYTRLSIYDTVEMDDGRWYQVGADQWVHQFNVAKVLPLADIPQSVDTEIWVGIDLYEQVVIAYEGNTPIFATLVSTGLPRWPTYEGTFHIYYRNPREYMSWGTVGDDFYSLEEVPWTMFFDEGRALHGAYWHDGLGYRRSHGCVNMSITDAHWMYQWVAEHMGKHRSADIEQGPAVYVYSSGEYE